MKLLLAAVMLPALATAGSSIREVYPAALGADNASFQTFELEIKDLPVHYVQSTPAPLAAPTGSVVPVSNGTARARLLMDLKKTPATFPIMRHGARRR